MSTTPTSTNVATFERFHCSCNSGDIDDIVSTIDEVFVPDAVVHSPLTAGSGPETMKRIWSLLLCAFPDIHVTVDDTIVDHDKIASRQTVTGTHLGEYRGLEPTGKTVVYEEIFIIRFSGGQIAEVWGVVDTLAQLQQLGAIGRV
ncbi:ester cyclase [Mycobacterium sp. CBMA293]|uniref:ester cyclase n=1 Tax=unclassified Mycolicibacterium TaxID=2636767 RepID=UPI001322BFDB|nr:MULTISPECIES: ester cyclase [unclassified Mycolicibacterium]MUL49855.1 ester cyclase [Mycolicibacterium sp. CBMA 360]MUL97128.1 ester cyclase [Mycolicibacterium sp. CBMA 230]MUM32898.1 ester cyclase [Mycolicibacterium sp. CBMA 361]MUL61511.1 ester cyclase [Mycolicibacterium sp. CBMA 335]MUL74246.1 ester cyclase [Mycolicibacterium sp. CBMA 311]